MRRSTRTLSLAALAAALLVAAIAWRAALLARRGRGEPATGSAAVPPRGEPLPPGAAMGSAEELPGGAGPEPWEEAAETVVLDLRGLVLGRPAIGAYAEARAEAARRDLALFPPDADRLRRLLLSPRSDDRLLALAALSARGAASDELVGVALRCARPWDEDLVRLLVADLVSALPPDQAARHEEEVLRAFAREPNPLVLAVALPALERLEAPRLRALLEAQLGVAAPEMVPVLASLARDRLGRDELRDLGISVFEGRRSGAAPQGE